MQIANRPEWFRSIKDARIVATFPAKNLDMDKNGDHLVATLKTIADGLATVEVSCEPLGSVTVYVPIYRKSVVPHTQSFFIVEDDFDIDSFRVYGQRLHPDCIVVLQEAPKIEGYTTSLIKFYTGYNVAVTKTANGILFWGIEGGGFGLYPDTIKETDSYKSGQGLISINGLSGNVWIKESYPVKVVTRTVGNNIQLTVTNEEVTR